MPEVRIGDAAIYIAMDTSGSMSGSRMAAQRTAVSRLIAEIGANALEPNDIQIVTWNSTVSGTILRRNADAAAYGELKDWVDALPTTVSGGTDFGAAVSQAGAFFNGAGGKRRILIFVTDGEPSPASSLEAAKATLAGLSEVDVFAFNIALSDTSATSQIDNTPVDGVPVVPAGDPDVLVASLRAAFGEGPDMNPAHIIRECLTNRDWGLGHGFTDIGPSFATAADALFAEGFGLSLLWQQELTIEDFIADVLKHIDAYLYVDRRSGRWELKLIRADYDAETLPTFDETNVVDWGELGRREAADLVNSVTVKFSDARTDQTGSVSVTDTALVQDLGQVVSATVDYPGIRYELLAVRVAERDLRALSSPILSGEITVTRVGADLDPGDVIRLVSLRRGLEGVAVRIVEIDHGDGRANGVRLRIAEDVFGLGDTALVGGESGDPGRLILPPKPLARRWVTEAPYWLLVQELGHAQADALLDEDPDAGALVAAGERPSADALSAQVWTDSGTGYALEAGVEFVPTALLTADVTDDPAERVLPVGSWTGLTDVTIGTLAAIGEELVRIDGVSATTLTVGRGCLDTVPQVHPAGTPVICWQLLPMRARRASRPERPSRSGCCRRRGSGRCRSPGARGRGHARLARHPAIAAREPPRQRRLGREPERPEPRAGAPHMGPSRPAPADQVVSIPTTRATSALSRVSPTSSRSAGSIPTPMRRRAACGRDRGRQLHQLHADQGGGADPWRRRGRSISRCGCRRAASPVA